MGVQEDDPVQREPECLCRGSDTKPRCGANDGDTACSPVGRRSGLQGRSWRTQCDIESSFCGLCHQPVDGVGRRPVAVCAIFRWKQRLDRSSGPDQCLVAAGPSGANPDTNSLAGVSTEDFGAFKPRSNGGNTTAASDNHCAVWDTGHKYPRYCRADCRTSALVRPPYCLIGCG